jgi:DNA mismatch repair protein MutL
MKQLSQRQSSTQRLLFPEVLKLSPTEDVVMQQLLPELGNIGFELSSLGGFNYSIAGVPSGMEGMSPVKLVHDLVADAVDAGHTAVEAGQQAIEKLHATIAISLARNAAIPVGQVLSNEEMENIVNLLFACSDVNHTPDGKNILSIMSHHKIEELLD